MLSLQQELYERHKDAWSPMEPEYGKDFFLYMIEELGEAIAIIKKKGCSAVAEDREVRDAFLTEMAGVLMYYNEILLRFHITPEKISDAYFKKHVRNMGGDYTQEYKELYHHG